MVGGSAGYQSNRNDLETVMVLQNQVKMSTSVYSGSMYAIVTREDEAMFATAGTETGVNAGQVVTLWRSDRKPLQPMCSFSTHQSPVHSMSFLFSCPLLVSCSDKLVICDYEHKVVLSVVSPPRGAFTCMTTSAVSVTGKGVNGGTAWQQVFCGTRSNEIVCYDIRQKFYDARLCAVFPLTPVMSQPSSPQEAMQVPMLCSITTLEDRYICAAWTNGIVDILSQRVGTPIIRWRAHARAVTKLQFLGHTRLLTACADGSISVWELCGSKIPKLTAQFTGLGALPNPHSLCVTECGMDVTVTAASGDVLLSNTEMDLRDYTVSPDERLQTFSLKSSAVSDGITANPLSKLRLGVTSLCPMRRIALCGSDDGKLYVLQ